MQAAIGCAQLARLDGFIAARKTNYARLLEALRAYEDRLILPRRAGAHRPVVVLLRDHRARGRRLHAQRADRLPRGEPHRDAQPLQRQPAAAPGLRGHRRAGWSATSTVTDAVMERTFFVGVYPGIDEARLDYMVEVFDRFMDGERAVVRARRRGGQPPGPLRRERGRRPQDPLHGRERSPTTAIASTPWSWTPARRCRASSPGSSCTWRSTTIGRAASGPSRACSPSPARLAERDRLRSPTPSRARSRHAWRASSRGAARLGQAALRGVRHRPGARRRAVRRRHGRHRLHGVPAVAGGPAGAAGAALLRRPDPGSVRLRSLAEDCAGAVPSLACRLSPRRPTAC